MASFDPFEEKSAGDRGTDYRRDTEEAVRARFLDEAKRERDRLKGKIDNPRTKLSEEALSLLDSLLPKEEDKEVIYSLMSVYEFVPLTEREMRAFIEDRVILSIRSVQTFYEFLHYEFGYSFGLDFAWNMKKVTHFDSHIALLNAALLEKNAFRKSGDEFDRAKSEGLAKIEDSIADTLRILKKNMDNGLMKSQLKRFQNVYSVPLSVSGIMIAASIVLRDKVNGDKWEKIVNSGVDFGELENGLGELFLGNEMILIIAAAKNKKSIDRVKAFISKFKLKRLQEVITPDLLDIIGAIKEEDAEDFMSYWNWLENEFFKSPLRLKHADHLYDEWRNVKGDNGRIWDKASADNSRLVASILTGEDLNLQDLFDHPSHYIWSQEEIDALKKLKTDYAVKVHKGNVSIGKIKRNILAILKRNGLLEKAIDSEYVAMYKAASERDRFGKGNEKEGSRDYLDGIIVADKAVEKLKIDIPDIENIFKVLGESGVRLGLLSSYIDNKSPILNDVLSKRLLPVLNKFSKDAECLKDWKLFSFKYGLNEGINFMSLDRFVDLSKEQRENLLKEENVSTIKTLNAEYGFKMLLKNIVTFVLELSVNGELRSAVKVLKSDNCIEFYRNNKGFAEGAKEFDEYSWQRELMIGYADMYKVSGSDRRYVKWAKKWLAKGNSLGPFFVREENSENLPLLDDPRIDRLYEVIGAMGLEMESLYAVADLIDYIDVLESSDFQAFYENTVEVYGILRGAFLLDDVILVYKDEEIRKFIASAATISAYKDFQEYGFNFDEQSNGNGYTSLVEKIEMFKLLTETPDMISSADTLAKTFGIDLKEQIKKAEAAEGGGFFGGFAKMLYGIDTRGFNFLVELKALIESGKFKTLVSKKTVDLVDYCHKAYNYKFSILDIGSILTVINSEHLSRTVMNPDMQKTLELLSSYMNKGDILEQLLGKDAKVEFSFSYLDMLADVMDNPEGFKPLMDTLVDKYGYTAKSAGDFLDVVDLVGREDVVKRLEDTKFQEWVKVFEKGKYDFKITDLYALIHIHDVSESSGENFSDSIYSKEMESFAERVFGKVFGHDLPARIAFFDTYKDPDKRKVLESANFSIVKERLAREFGITGGIDNAEGFIELINNQEVFEFLHSINFRRLSGFMSRAGLDFFDGISSLVTMRRCGAAKYILALGERSKSSNSPKKKEDRWWYSFNVLDGRAWEAITAQNPDLDTFVASVESFATKAGKRTLTIDDIYIGLLAGNDFPEDRLDLERGIEKNFEDDVHRVDHNFDSYSSYNDISKFSTMQLYKVRLMQDWFSGIEAKESIRAFLKKDVEDYPFAELGSVVVLNPDGSINNNEHPPKHHFYNGSYAPPSEAKLDYSVALATSHNHALKHEGENWAGPSGSRFRLGGDISVAKIYEKDAIVITSLSAKEFGVHFYDKDGDVLFVGRYKYKKLKEAIDSVRNP